jgi:hypothetical protein
VSQIGRHADVEQERAALFLLGTEHNGRHGLMPSDAPHSQMHLSPHQIGRPAQFLL